MKTESDKEFVHEINTAAQKLEQLTSTVPVTLVLPPSCDDVPDTAGRSEYMHDVLSKVENLTIVGLHDVEVDQSSHPTEQGTLTILDQIHQATNIIMDDCRDDATLPVKYCQVQPVFKSGCRGCDRLDYTPTLCLTCKQNAESLDTSILSRIIDKHKARLFPPIEIDNPRVKEGHKRPADNNNHGTTPKAVKTD